MTIDAHRRQVLKFSLLAAIPGLITLDVRFAAANDFNFFTGRWQVRHLRLKPARSMHERAFGPAHPQGTSMNNKRSQLLASACLATLLVSPSAALADGMRPDQVAFREIYQELVKVYVAQR